jgi:hypothetical protein
MSDLPALEKMLYALELELMRPSTRGSRATLEEMIDEEFVAFASTGAVYDREATLSALLLERPQAWSIGGFRARLIAPGVALTTYVATTSTGPSSQRSSIWRLADGRWRMTFHQGTPVRD